MSFKDSKSLATVTSSDVSNTNSSSSVLKAPLRSPDMVVVVCFSFFVLGRNEKKRRGKNCFGREEKGGNDRWEGREGKERRERFKNKEERKRDREREGEKEKKEKKKECGQTEPNPNNKRNERNSGIKKDEF